MSPAQVLALSMDAIDYVLDSEFYPGQPPKGSRHSPPGWVKEYQAAREKLTEWHRQVSPCGPDVLAGIGNVFRGPRYNPDAHRPPKAQNG